MTVGIMKSFALGNVVIAPMLPGSMSALINNKLWGCRWERVRIKKQNKEWNKSRGHRWRPDVTFRWRYDLRSQSSPEKSNTDAIHTGSTTLSSLFQFYLHLGSPWGDYFYSSEEWEDSTAFVPNCILYVEGTFAFSSGSCIPTIKRKENITKQNK